MRNSLILAAAAPLALLAACGDNDVEDADTDADVAADTMANDTAADEDGSATALSDAGDYSGVYSHTADDGTETAIRLNAADRTYEYVGPDNEVRSGRYSWAEDGYRLKIDDWYGDPAWFTISNGQLVKLVEDMEVNEGITVSGERYQRAEDGDAVFSRFPSLGSPVAPDVSED